MNREQFEQELADDGYSVKESSMQPKPPAAMRTHDFDARLLILEGEITITREDGATTYREGDIYSLPAGTPHFETVGADGVKYVVGRRDSS